MKWVRIEDGCEMPEDMEIVIACNGDGEWQSLVYSCGKWHPVEEDLYAGMSDEAVGVTHWARVELPEG